MKLIQVDPFGDGWWADVELDSGERRLMHIYDRRGRKAPKPKTAEWEKLAALVAQTPATPPPNPLAELEELKSAVRALAATAATASKKDLVAAIVNLSEGVS